MHGLDILFEILSVGMLSLFSVAVNTTVKITVDAAGSLFSDLLIAIPSVLGNFLSDTLGAQHEVAVKIVFASAANCAVPNDGIFCGGTVVTRWMRIQGLDL